MKNNYERYMQEVWDMKDRAYQDFKTSGYAKYTDYLNHELKDIRIRHKEINKKQEELSR